MDIYQAREWQCRYVFEDQRCCLLPLNHDGPHSWLRYGVVSEHNQHGGWGWAVIDRQRREITGGWFADRIAAERTADTLNTA